MEILPQSHHESSQIGLELHWLGQLSYGDGLLAQHHAHQRVINSSQHIHMLGLEHLPVVTLGKRGKIEDDLNVSSEQLAQKGFELISIDRGGQATLHNPGQLVIYPVMNLRAHHLTVKSYVHLLEEVSLAFFKKLGIQVHRATDEPGLYTDQGKICFFGIRILKGISLHGLALNVSNNTQDFAMIRSCGKSQEQFDQISHYHSPSHSLANYFELWCQTFTEILTNKEQRQRTI